jgi:hypothetical protein
MNSLAASSEYPSTMPTFHGEASARFRKHHGIRLNGHIAIYTVATVLALATASECHGITYLPSLRYGAVLWLWWGVIASALWRLGRRVPLVSSFSPKTITVHLVLASFLGVAHLLLLGSLDLRIRHGTFPSGWVRLAGWVSIGAAIPQAPTLPSISLWTTFPG